jgi:N-6 DNA Methylase
VPELSDLLEYEKVLDALWQFTKDLAELIKAKQNSIWSFIIRNSYRPAMLKKQFDLIIGNPPWLSYRYISDPEYQKEIKNRAVEKYQIAPKSQKLFTQMELATVFLAHSMATFANANGRLGFVMPRGVLSADQHQNLIQRKYSSDAKFRLTGYWDLWEVVPLFNVPACVLFAKYDRLHGSPKEKLPVLEWNGTLPERDVPWDVAKARLSSEKKDGRVIYLGSRAALSTAPGASVPSRPSKYKAVFKQGATIVPRSFYFVQVSDLDGAPDLDKQYWAVTDPVQAREAKVPYDEVKLEHFVDGRFLFSSALSKHVAPFVVMNPAVVVLPVVVRNGQPSLISSDGLRREGYREFAEWMSQAETIWLEKREGKAGRISLLGWLDYQGKLTAQNLNQRHLVLYNAAGTNVSAAHFDRKSNPLPFVVEHKLYWAAFNDPTEADYVCAVLNSETVNVAIKPFQSTGLLGERDIEKKLLELPIPTFDHELKKHTKLAELGGMAREEAAKLLKSGEFPVDSSIARQRAFVRVHLSSVMDEIDGLVAKLLS